MGGDDSSLVNYSDASSFNYSCTDDNRCNEESHSDSSMNELANWKKVQTLITTLKEVQLNLEEIGVVINKNNEEKITQLQEEGKLQYTPLDECIDSSKTDEAKLNEILSLLHHIANSLTAYEDNPLLVVNECLKNKSLSELDFKNTKEAKNDSESVSLEMDTSTLREYAPTPSYKSQSDTSSVNIISRQSSLNVDTHLDNLGLRSCRNEVPVSNSYSVDQNKPLNTYSDSHTHLFANQTKSLRKEIDGIIQRKEALDDRLHLLVLQRLRENDDLDLEPEKLYSTAESVDSPSVSVPTPPLIPAPVKNCNKKKLKSKRALKNGNGSSGKIVGSQKLQENATGEKIQELKHEEEVLIGSADDGLSSEIDSLNITIQELVKENQNFYSFFQGITGQKPMSRIFGSSNIDSLKIDASVSKTKLNSAQEGPNKNTVLDNRSLNSKENFRCSETTDNSFLKNDPIDIRKECDRSVTSATDNSNQAFEKSFVCQLACEKKACEDRTAKLQSKVDDISHANRQQMEKYVAEIEKQKCYNTTLEEKINNLFALNEELRCNVKNLNRTPQSADELKNISHSVTHSNQTIGTDQKENADLKGHPNVDSDSESIINNGISSAIPSEDNLTSCHEVCQMHIQKLIDQNQSLERQLFIAKAQLQGSKRKGSFPGATKNDNLFFFRNIMKENEFNEQKPIDEYCAKVFLSRKANVTKELENLKCKVNFLENVVSVMREADATTVSEDDDDDFASSSKSTCTKISDEASAEECADSETEIDLNGQMKMLMNEKNSLSERLEELMTISQELAYHFKQTKEKLVEVTHERDFLIAKDIGAMKTSFEIQKDFSDLQQRGRHLENELEKAYQLIHEKNLVTDRLVAENRNLKQSFQFALSSINEENNTLLESRNESLQKELHLLRLQLLTEKEMNNSPRNDDSQAKEEKNHSTTNCQEKNSERLPGDKVEKEHLLEMALVESSQKATLLQQTLKETIEAYEDLQVKYQKLRRVLHTKKTEKLKQKKLLNDCSSKVEELSSTTSAIEDNYKMMLSILGKNIGIAVELLASHLYVSSCEIHPSPELSEDASFWFAAQCSRLRWLQAHLKKLGLNAWKLAAVGVSSDKNIWSPMVFNKLRQMAILKDGLKSKSFEDTSLLPNKITPVTTEESCSSWPPSGVFDPAPKLETKMEDPKKDTDEGNVLNTPPSSKGPDEHSPPHPSANSEPLTGGTDANKVAFVDVPPGRMLDSNVWVTLNDAEMHLTHQQMKLVKTRTSQLNSLVGILQKEEGKDSSLSKSVMSLSSFASDKTLETSTNEEGFKSMNVDSSDSESSCRISMKDSSEKDIMGGN